MTTIRFLQAWWETYRRHQDNSSNSRAMATLSLVGAIGSVWLMGWQGLVIYLAGWMVGCAGVIVNLRRAERKAGAAK